MNRNRFALALIAAVTLAAAAPPCLAQGAVARHVAEEVVEAIVKKGGRDAAEDLATLGGERAVRELLEKAAREGGEELAGRAAHYGRVHGVAALRLMERSPKAWITALDGLPADMVTPALRAAAREPEVVTRLVGAYGREALEVVARHPGVGTRVAEKLGAEGIETAGRLTTDQAMVLARHADEIAGLPPGTRSQVLAKIGRSPGVMLDYLERHPRVLLTAAGVATVLAVKDNFLGEPGQRTIHPDGTIVEPAPGLLERVGARVADRAQEPINVGIGLLGVLLASWGAIQLWHVWRVKQLRRASLGAKS